MSYNNRNNNNHPRNNDYNRDGRYYNNNNNNNYRSRQEKRHDNDFGNRNDNRYGDRSYNSDNNSRGGYNDSGGNYNNSRQGSWNDSGNSRRYHQQQQYDRQPNQSNSNHLYNRKRGRDEVYPRYNDGTRTDRGSGDLKRSRTVPSRIPDTFPPQSKPVLGRSESAPIKNVRTKTEDAKDKNILSSTVEQTEEQKLAVLESSLRFKKISNSTFELLKYQFKIDGFEQRVQHLDERIAALANM